MDGIELVRLAFREVHEAIEVDLEGLGRRELFSQPEPGANHIGFLLWHLVRDEDVVVSDVAGLRSIWSTTRWDDRLNISVAGQGTGFDKAALADFRFKFSDFMAYARAVWSATDDRLSKLTPEDLDGAVHGSPGRSVGSLLMTGSVGHDWVHLGEIRYIRGLQGWRFRE